jgi:hypothetical protein
VSSTPHRELGEESAAPEAATPGGEAGLDEAKVGAPPGDAELRAWKERALAAERWRDEVWRPLLERAAEGQRARDLERRLAEIESNTWWRLAAPFRAVSRFLRGNWSRLRERE